MAIQEEDHVGGSSVEDSLHEVERLKGTGSEEANVKENGFVEKVRELETHLGDKTLDDKVEAQAPVEDPAEEILMDTKADEQSGASETVQVVGANGEVPLEEDSKLTEPKGAPEFNEVGRPTETEAKAEEIDAPVGGSAEHEAEIVANEPAPVAETYAEPITGDINVPGEVGSVNREAKGDEPVSIPETGESQSSKEDTGPVAGGEPETTTKDIEGIDNKSEARELPVEEAKALDTEEAPKGDIGQALTEGTHEQGKPKGEDVKGDELQESSTLKEDIQEPVAVKEADPTAKDAEAENVAAPEKVGEVLVNEDEAEKEPSEHEVEEKSLSHAEKTGSEGLATTERPTEVVERAPDDQPVETRVEPDSAEGGKEVSTEKAVEVREGGDTAEPTGEETSLTPETGTEESIQGDIIPLPTEEPVEQDASSEETVPSPPVQAELTPKETAEKDVETEKEAEESQLEEAPIATQEREAEENVETRTLPVPAEGITSVETPGDDNVQKEAGNIKVDEVLRELPSATAEEGKDDELVQETQKEVPEQQTEMPVEETTAEDKQPADHEAGADVKVEDSSKETDNVVREEKTNVQPGEASEVVGESTSKEVPEQQAETPETTAEQVGDGTVGDEPAKAGDVKAEDISEPNQGEEQASSASSVEEGKDDKLVPEANEEAPEQKQPTGEAAGDVQGDEQTAIIQEATKETPVEDTTVEQGGHATVEEEAIAPTVAEQSEHVDVNLPGTTGAEKVEDEPVKAASEEVAPGVGQVEETERSIDLGGGEETSPAEHADVKAVQPSDGQDVAQESETKEKEVQVQKPETVVEEQTPPPPAEENTIDIKDEPAETEKEQATQAELAPDQTAGGEEARTDRADESETKEEVEQARISPPADEVVERETTLGSLEESAPPPPASEAHEESETTGQAAPIKHADVEPVQTNVAQDGEAKDEVPVTAGEPGVKDEGTASKPQESVETTIEGDAQAENGEEKGNGEKDIGGSSVEPPASEARETAGDLDTSEEAGIGEAAGTPAEHADVEPPVEAVESGAQDGEVKAVESPEVPTSEAHEAAGDVETGVEAGAQEATVTPAEPVEKAQGGDGISTSVQSPEEPSSTPAEEVHTDANVEDTPPVGEAVRSIETPDLPASEAHEGVGESAGDHDKATLNESQEEVPPVDEAQADLGSVKAEDNVTTPDEAQPDAHGKELAESEKVDDRREGLETVSPVEHADEQTVEEADHKPDGEVREKEDVEVTSTEKPDDTVPQPRAVEQTVIEPVEEVQGGESLPRSVQSPEEPTPAEDVHGGGKSESPEVQASESREGVGEPAGEVATPIEPQGDVHTRVGEETKDNVTTPEEAQPDDQGTTPGSEAKANETTEPTSLVEHADDIQTAEEAQPDVREEEEAVKSATTEKVDNAASAEPSHLKPSVEGAAIEESSRTVEAPSGGGGEATPVTPALVVTAPVEEQPQAGDGGESIKAQSPESNVDTTEALPEPEQEKEVKPKSETEKIEAAVKPEERHVAATEKVDDTPSVEAEQADSKAKKQVEVPEVLGEVEKDGKVEEKQVKVAEPESESKEQETESTEEEGEGVEEKDNEEAKPGNIITSALRGLVAAVTRGTGGSKPSKKKRQRIKKELAAMQSTT